MVRKNLSLFGAHLRTKREMDTFKRWQISRPLPPKAYGLRPPSYASQMGLWHNDDYNYMSNVHGSNRKSKKFLVPLTYKKDFQSTNLNCLVTNMSTSPSAMYAMDDMGGFDEYIMRSTPEEIRSSTAEKIKNLMYYYHENPEVKDWGLPYKVLLRKKEQKDPTWARYKHLAVKEHMVRRTSKQHAPYSPYYLPENHQMEPARQNFMSDAESVGDLKLWWQQNPELERRFRNRLKEAKGFERRFADHREAGGYRKGHGMGRGGPSNTHVNKRDKKHRFRDSRPY